MNNTSPTNNWDEPRCSRKVNRLIMRRIRCPPCYSYIQSGPVKVSTVIEERKNIHIHMSSIAHIYRFLCCVLYCLTSFCVLCPTLSLVLGTGIRGVHFDLLSVFVFWVTCCHGRIPTSQYNLHTLLWSIPTCQYNLSTSLWSLPTSLCNLPTLSGSLPTSEYNLPTSLWILPTSQYKLPSLLWSLPTSQCNLLTSLRSLPTSEYNLPTLLLRLPTSEYNLPTLLWSLPTS
jgi:hypothetical protein